MPEPFKNLFNEETVRELAASLERGGPIDREEFVADALNGLGDLELKDRVRHLGSVMQKHLPQDFSEAAAQLIRALPPPLADCKDVTSGLLVWPMCQFVEDHGVDDPDVSLPALYELTRRFSAEFAIRPFLIRYPERTLALLDSWTSDPDPHVRRLVSEGSRPRLPWGQRLQFLVDDPQPLIPLLEKLRDDPEESVRRSVANNINDIAKDHPEVAVEVCGRWSEDAPPERRKLIKHALRTLVKQGHSGALELLGFGPPLVEVLSFGGPHTARIGNKIDLALELRSTAEKEQNLVIDYAMHFPGAGGRINRKVFKWRTAALSGNDTLKTTKSHSFKPVSTRKTRPGAHRFELLINGNSLAFHDLELTPGEEHRNG